MVFYLSKENAFEIWDKKLVELLLFDTYLSTDPENI